MGYNAVGHNTGLSMFIRIALPPKSEKNPAKLSEKSNL